MAVASGVSDVRLAFAQKAFIVHDGRLLLVRRSASDPVNPGRWEVPGGRLDVTGDADLDDHIRREVWEEVGLHIDPGPPFYVWDWRIPDRDGSGRVRVVAIARTCRPLTTQVSTAHRTTDDHLAEVEWVPLGGLDGFNLIPNMRPVMREFLRLRADNGSAIPHERQLTG